LTGREIASKSVYNNSILFRNPEEFKIRCLKDIQTIFEEKNPFFAGYGNRPNVSISLDKTKYSKLPFIFRMLLPTAL
jgi:phosphatidate phosphatase PAH1